MLAARARGLGTAWTTVHLMQEQAVAELLGMPFGTTQQVCLSPLAYTLGTDFNAAARPEPESSSTGTAGSRSPWTPTCGRPPSRPPASCPPDEGDALYEAALASGAAVPGAPFLEVGSYCGRSTVCWAPPPASVARSSSRRPPPRLGGEPGRLVAARHLSSTRTGGWTPSPVPPGHPTTPAWSSRWSASSVRRRRSPRHWTTPLALVFIDGGHGGEPARADSRAGRPTSALGGPRHPRRVPRPADGGRPAYEEIYRPALARGRCRRRRDGLAPRPPLHPRPPDPDPDPAPDSTLPGPRPAHVRGSGAGSSHGREAGQRRNPPPASTRRPWRSPAGAPRAVGGGEDAAGHGG